MMLLSARDMKRLEGVHADLVSVVRRAFQIWDTQKTGLPLIVTEGVRTLKRQQELFAMGRTAPGKKVTWTMVSRHLTGHAVDIAIIREGKIPNAEDPLWDTLGECMFDAAKELQIKIRWGGDWDQAGIAHERGEGDLVHFELPASYYP